MRKTAPYSVAQYLDGDDDDEIVKKGGFLEWAEEEGFRPLWNIQKEFGGHDPSPELDAAFQIFVNPFARSVVGMMLMSQATTEEAAEIVTTRFDLGIDAPALDLYTQIFWDGSQISRKGWTSFLGELRTREERHYLALGLSSPTADEARQFLGMNTCFAPEEILIRIMSKAHAQFESAMEQPIPEEAGAIKWAELAIKAINTISSTKKTFGESDGDQSLDFKGLFSVQVEKIQHVSLAELQGEVSPKAPVEEVKKPAEEE